MDEKRERDGDGQTGRERNRESLWWNSKYQNESKKIIDENGDYCFFMEKINSEDYCFVLLINQKDFTPDE